MSILNLKYGNGVVTLNVRNTAKLEKLTLPALTPLSDVGRGFVDAASYQCVSTPGLNVIVSPQDLVTIVIRNDRKIQPEHLISMLTYYLHSLGMPYENMAVLVVGGPECAAGVIPPELTGKFTVEAHDCDSPDLVSFGTTSHGVPVTGHPLLQNRKVILVDGVRRDPLTGFSGGPEFVLQACGRATIEGCYGRASSGGVLSPHIRSGVIVGNPLCEEMTEVARLINPFFGIYAMMDSAGRFFRFVCGGWLDAWYESCNEVQQYFGVAVSGPGDIVAASCGGYPFDATLESACRSLFHAAQTVREGGTIILAAECRDGGPEAFLEGTGTPHSPGGLVRLEFQALTRKYRVLMQSKIHTQTLAALGLEGFRTMETLESKVDFSGQVVRFLPFADIAAPYQI